MQKDDISLDLLLYNAIVVIFIVLQLQKSVLL